MSGSKERVLGVVLAGGASARFGSPKWSAQLGGRSLMEWAIARARPQVDEIAVSVGPAEAHHIAAAIPDLMPGQGPLAAVLGCLRWGAERGFGLVATFPCDAPFFPPDLVRRLREGLAASDCVMARRGADAHYAFALWRTAAASHLADAVEQGVRSFRAIQPFLSRGFADFPLQGEGPQGNAFFNINRAEDLAEAERCLKSHPL